jgi:hypothetical protein
MYFGSVFANEYEYEYPIVTVGSGCQQAIIARPPITCKRMHETRSHNPAFSKSPSCSLSHYGEITTTPSPRSSSFLLTATC